MGLIQKLTNEVSTWGSWLRQDDPLLIRTSSAGKDMMENTNLLNVLGHGALKNRQ